MSEHNPPHGEPEKESIRSPDHAQAQRDRILDASEKCFIQHGFHAASMARIAETAGISQGLAYRYFKSKSDIILAIIERQLSEKLTRQAGRDCLSVDSYVEEALTFIREWATRDPGRASPILFLEMCAEASRDPEIADALRKADTVYLKHFSASLSRLAEQSGKVLAQQEIEARFYAMQCLVEGIAAISSRRPQSHGEPINDHVRAIIRQLFTP